MCLESDALAKPWLANVGDPITIQIKKKSRQQAALRPSSPQLIDVGYS